MICVLIWWLMTTSNNFLGKPLTVVSQSLLAWGYKIQVNHSKPFMSVIDDNHKKLNAVSFIYLYVMIFPLW